MRNNRFRDVLAAGQMPVGHMVWEFGTRGIPRILEAAGVDFVLFDMEHSGIGFERIADLLAFSRTCTFTPMVRVPQAHYHFLARVLDAGALGVMIANVQTVEQAREILAAVKYPPDGMRGVGLGAAHTDYVVPDPVSYFRGANASTVVICQIESPLGVENCDAIAALPGVDVVWVGHFDLSTQMGIPGDFQNPKFLHALQTVTAAAKMHGKNAGIQPGSIEQARQWKALGFDVMSFGADSAVYRAAVTAGIEQIRNL